MSESKRIDYHPQISSIKNIIPKVKPNDKFQTLCFISAPFLPNLHFPGAFEFLPLIQHESKTNVPFITLRLFFLPSIYRILSHPHSSIHPSILSCQVLAPFEMYHKLKINKKISTIVFPCFISICQCVLFCSILLYNRRSKGWRYGGGNSEMLACTNRKNWLCLPPSSCSGLIYGFDFLFIKKICYSSDLHLQLHCSWITANREGSDGCSCLVYLKYWFYFQSNGKVILLLSCLLLMVNENTNCFLKKIAGILNILKWDYKSSALLYVHMRCEESR